MTGWRLGWAQGSERTIRLMYKAAEFMTSNPAAMVQQAGMVALRDGESYVGELRDHYDEQVVTGPGRDDLLEDTRLRDYLRELRAGAAAR